jgi:membrane protein
LKYKFKIPDTKELQQNVNRHPLVIKTLEWTKHRSLPGFYGVPIYNVIVFVINEMRRLDLEMRANSIAFSFFMSLFPSLLTLFTLLPFLQQYLLQYLPEGENFNLILQTEIQKLMPGEAGNTLYEFISDITTNPRVGLLSFGFILAIYFSSNGMLAMMQSFEKSYKTTFRQRGMIKKRLVAIFLTGLLGALLIASIVLIILGSFLINLLSEYIAMAGLSTRAIDLLRWVAIILLFYVGIAVIYRYGAATHKRIALLSPGATLATTLSILSSVAFSFYIDELGRFDTYAQFYGSIATIIIVMLWMQLNSLILLIGFELNASIAINRDIRIHEEEAKSPT